MGKEKLGLLNDFITKDEIKRLITHWLSCHPDKKSKYPGIEKEFDETAKAYKILWEYCQGDSCHFDEEAFKKNAILVKVRVG